MFQIALEKFKVPTADFAPRINNTWVAALYRVDSDVQRVRDHPNRTLLRGYALPDPHAFLRSTSRLDIYTACWLMIRPLWINLAINRQADQNGDCSPYPEPQDWKAFLFDLFGKMGLSLPSSSSSGDGPTSSQFVASSGASRGRRERAKRRRIQDENDRFGKFKLDTSEFTAPADVYWRGKLLFSKDALRSSNFRLELKVAKEIIWELFNGNFALELLATDRVVFPRDKMEEYGALERDTNVAACFPDGVLVGMEYPKVDRGLGALHWQDRLEYVEALRSLLSTWGGAQAAQLGKTPALSITSLGQQVEQVERLAYPFYCQTFFDYFGRAPCVPCQLPRA